VRFVFCVFNEGLWGVGVGWGLVLVLVGEMGEMGGDVYVYVVGASQIIITK